MSEIKEDVTVTINLDIDVIPHFEMLHKTKCTDMILLGANGKVARYELE